MRHPAGLMAGKDEVTAAGRALVLPITANLPPGTLASASATARLPGQDARSYPRP